MKWNKIKILETIQMLENQSSGFSKTPSSLTASIMACLLGKKGHLLSQLSGVVLLP